jgi:hypothetical protein
MSFFTSLRNTVESAAVVAGNYFVPASSVLTYNIASTGSQKQLGSTLGTVALLGSGAAGLGIGSSITGIGPSTVGSMELAGLSKAGSVIKSGAAALFGSGSPATTSGVTAGTIASGIAAAGGSSGTTLSPNGQLVNTGSYPMGPLSTSVAPPIIIQGGAGPAQQPQNNSMLLFAGIGLVAAKILLFK